MAQDARNLHKPRNDRRRIERYNLTVYFKLMKELRLLGSCQDSLLYVLGWLGAEYFVVSKIFCSRISCFLEFPWQSRSGSVVVPSVPPVYVLLPLVIPMGPWWFRVYLRYTCSSRCGSPNGPSIGPILHSCQVYTKPKIQCKFGAGW